MIFPSKQQKVNTLYISIFKTTFWILSMWLSHFVCNPQQICSSVYTAILWTTDVTSIGDLRHQRLHAFGFVWHLLAGSSHGLDGPACEHYQRWGLIQICILEYFWKESLSRDGSRLGVLDQIFEKVSD